MGGERCGELYLTAGGIQGDRQLAFESIDAPKGKPLLRAAQRAAMLRFVARSDPGGHIQIGTPSGRLISAEDPAAPQLLAHELAELNPALAPPGLSPKDPWLALLRSGHPLTDVRPVAVHSLQTAHRLARELDATRLPTFSTGFDHRRLRSNLVLDLTQDLAVFTPQGSGAQPPRQPLPEHSLAGRTLQIGSAARLRITEPIPRCHIVALAPQTADHDPHLLRHLAREHRGRAGVYGRPVTEGPLREGDPVWLV